MTWCFGILHGIVGLPDLLKSAPQLQAIATTIVAGVPLAEIVKRIVLPSADVLGKRMADRVERCFGKAAKMIEDAGVTPQPVEDKLVVEILRGASLEDNEDLHTMWAALLANAASKETRARVRIGFVEILRHMSPDEATLLNWISEHIDEYRAVLLQTAVFPLKQLFADIVLLEDDLTNVRVCLNRLEADMLLTRTSTDRENGFIFQSEENESNFSTGFPYYLTCAGIEFILAARPPKPKA